MNYIEELQDMIRHRYGAESVHLGKRPGKRNFRGKDHLGRQRGSF